MFGKAREPLEGFYFSTGRTNIFRGFTVKIFAPGC
jgi:hypothetical protein